MPEMFKIVQTIERGLKHLTIVPSAWENNNKLSWPKTGADKLIQKPDSVPEANWFTMPCKLKRNYLINYTIAEEELRRMLENDDTEQEEIEEPIHKKPQSRLVKKNKPDNQDNDFNSVANECLMPVIVEKSALISSAGCPTEIIVPQNMLTTENSFQIIPNDGNFSSLFETTEMMTSVLDPKLNEKIEKILANQEIIIDNQNKLLKNLNDFKLRENEERIIQHLATLQATQDLMASNSISNKCTCKTAKHNAQMVIRDDIFFDPIETLEELERVEAKLGDKNEMEDYVQKFSYVCRKKGSGNGMSNCYILVDKIFSRKFMTLCSWAGGARDGKEKIPFKIFKNMIALFFRVVRLSDEDFTLKNCEEFFKAVIRNSTKRSESTLARGSRSKRRPSSLSYKIRKGKLATSETNNIAVDATEKIIEINEKDNPAVSNKDNAENDADGEVTSDEADQG